MKTLLRSAIMTGFIISVLMGIYMIYFGYFHNSPTCIAVGVLCYFPARDLLKEL